MSNDKMNGWKCMNQLLNIRHGNAATVSILCYVFVMFILLGWVGELN